MENNIFFQEGKNVKLKHKCSAQFWQIVGFIGTKQIRLGGFQIYSRPEKWDMNLAKIVQLLNILGHT